MDLYSTGQFIERFGFPLFFGVCALFMFWRIWIYFSKCIERKDVEFLTYIEKQDARYDKLEEKHNLAFRENTIAFNRLSNAIESSLRMEKRGFDIVSELFNTANAEAKNLEKEN